MAELEIIADYGDLCGEGPVWDAARGHLYWTDVTGRRFYRLDWPSRKHEILSHAVQVNGFRRNRPGGWIMTNGAGIWFWDGAGNITLIADEVDGAKCHMNDCGTDSAGRLFSGSVLYDPHQGYELGKLFRVDLDGTVAIVDEGFHLSNGIAFSPDEATLYFTDSVARRIHAYDYDSRTGAVCRRRVLVTVPGEEGIPDGLAVDAEGFLWSAQWYGSCVVRYDPDGKVERRIPTPAKQTSSVAFGGPDLTDIFITSAGQSEPMPIMPPGYDPVGGYFGGQLYHTNLRIPGQLQSDANIRLRSS